ncbi:fatty acid desaturase [Micromonospora carbonacea]|uniref:fatty acid desaturase n=1 Tax=Micromonospora carbonacea TaxID=47853 RepID=UPI003713DF05
MTTIDASARPADPDGTVAAPRRTAAAPRRTTGTEPHPPTVAAPRRAAATGPHQPTVTAPRRPASRAGGPAAADQRPGRLTVAERDTRDSADNSVRDSMRRLPRFAQLPLTFLTGRPHTGQRPLRLTPTAHLVTATGSVAVGLTATGVALALSGWWLALLLPGWASTLHGARNLRMMVFHQCAHRNMWARKRPDQILGKIVAGVLMVQHFERYSAEHVADHHALHHMTLRDPTVQAFLVSLRLRPGMTRRQMWRQVLGRLTSPVFHARFLWARIRSYSHAASRTERALTATGYAAVAALATVAHAWPLVLVGWVLPMTVFFQVSNTLRLCVKHTFPAPWQTQRRGKAYFASLTNAIFIGEPAPASSLRGGAAARAWARWWTRMLLVHFPSRYLVLTGDTVCHDFHHRRPMSRDWANYIFARQADIDGGHRGWPPYREIWGLIPAINLVLDSLAEADPDEFDPQRLAETSDRELFAAFDD